MALIYCHLTFSGLRIIFNITDRTLKQSNTLHAPLAKQVKFIVVLRRIHFFSYQCSGRFNIRLIAKPSQKLKDNISRKNVPFHFENYSALYDITFIKTDWSKNFYIGMDRGKFNCRNKQHKGHIKYTRKITALARLYQGESTQINVNETKIFFYFNLY